MAGNIIHDGNLGYLWNRIKNKFAKKEDLATVATSGSYNDLDDKPEIPTKTSDLINDGEGGSLPSPFITADQVAPSNWTETNTEDPSFIQNKPSIKAGTGTDSIVEGDIDNNDARGNYSHAEGKSTQATRPYSHAEGYQTVASGSVSHAEGNSTTASGYYSHAEGLGTIAKNRSNHVFGEYNIQDTGSDGQNKGTYIEIVGNGEDSDNRSNARVLDWNGNEILAGTSTASDFIIPGSPNTSLSNISNTINNLATVATSGNYNDLTNRPVYEDELREYSLSDTDKVNDLSLSSWFYSQPDITESDALSFIGRVITFGYGEATLEDAPIKDQIISTDENEMIQLVELTDTLYEIYYSYDDDWIGFVSLADNQQGPEPSFSGYTFNKGVYIRRYTYEVEEGGTSVTYDSPYLIESDVILHQLEEKFIPNTITRNSDLSRVATTNDYDDLDNKPVFEAYTDNEIQTLWNNA